jgi:hypothetical protein
MFVFGQDHQPDFLLPVVHDLAEVNPSAAFKPSDVLSPRKTQNRAHIEPHKLPALLATMGTRS